MAKKKSKQKAKARTTAKATAKKKKGTTKVTLGHAAWEGRVFSFEGVDDGEIVQNAPNRFTLVKVGFEDKPHPHLYQIKSETTNPVLPLWQDVKLVWHPGIPFDMRFGPFSGPDPSAERKRRFKVTKNKVKDFVPEDLFPFERLVGLSKTHNGKDAIITLLLAEKNDPDGTKGIIVGLVDQQVGSPNGAGVGNG